ncbi:MAG TPA: beta-ketoacyl synthase, partial [Chitinophagaceae bacterium]|nr:beta-ketoacyl synthase [Chitinophagaceae bacterium]
GKSGDANSDAVIDKILSPLFKSSSTAVYKNLCGEYYTSTAFALWLAYSILKTGKIPAEIIDQDRGRDIKTILIYNPYFKEHHSLVLLSSE